MNEECNLEVLKLNYDWPDDFAKFICQRDDGASMPYMCLRIAMYLYRLAMLAYAVALLFLHPELKLSIFFDFWVNILLGLTAEFGLYVIIQRCSDDKVDYQNGPWEYMPWFCKLCWIFYSAMLPSVMLSVIVYWTQMYPENKHIIHILMNTATPIMVIIDFILIAFPIRLLHFIFFTIFYVVYILFTLIYQKAGGTGTKNSIPIYKNLDWNSPGKAILTAFIGLAIGLGFYFLFCFLSMGKLWLRNRIIEED